MVRAGGLRGAWLPHLLGSFRWLPVAFLLKNTVATLIERLVIGMSMSSNHS